jgi:5-methyltetrahydropteroyltriglutamate--homocysteine methyltransferase
MSTPSPAIQTTVVGSYPIPNWLAAYPSAQALRDAILVVLKTQELAGIDVIADGELSRFDINHPETNGMIEYFVKPMGGGHTDFTHDELTRFRKMQGMGFRTKPAAVVRQKLTEGSLDLVADWEAVKKLSTKPMKFTVTAPYMLAKTLLDSTYKSLPDLCMGIAQVLAAQVKQIDAAIVQVDEANLTGHPEDASWAHESINVVLDAVRHQRALHLCFGNYGGSTIQKGFWKNLIPFLNKLHVDHLVLEFARRGYDELEYFKDLRPDIKLGIGVIDIKDNEVETADEVAARIDKSIKVLGPEKIKWVHPDCGFWMLSRSVSDRKMAALVKGRDTALGSAS